MVARRHRSTAGALALALGLFGAADRAAADEQVPGTMPEIGERGSVNVAPKELDGVDVTEKLGAQLPLDAPLRDETGAPVQLGELLGDGLPVILTFNYSSCPMLCSVMLGGLTKALAELDWSAGQQFRVVTISIDPKETQDSLMEAKQAYVGRYGRAGAEDGWRFLTAEPQVVRQLAAVTGFGYRVVDKTGEVLHPAVLILLSSEGVVSRYIYGVEFDKTELRAALASTALGKVTASTAKFLHACFSYEQPRGFAATAMRAMRLGGLFFLFGLAATFAIARHVRSSRASRAEPAGSH